MRQARRGIGIALVTALAVSGCGMLRGNPDREPVQTPSGDEILDDILVERGIRSERNGGTIWDIFSARPDAGQVGAVNRYLWNASLETLSFLPVETVDPFTGVIVTGFGTPPGGGRAYRATILIDDPALDARSLNVALLTSSGPVAPETLRAVEDAILTRARQLRAQDSRY